MTMKEQIVPHRPPPTFERVFNGVWDECQALCNGGIERERNREWDGRVGRESVVPPHLLNRDISPTRPRETAGKKYACARADEEELQFAKNVGQSGEWKVRNSH